MRLKSFQFSPPKRRVTPVSPHPRPFAGPGTFNFVGVRRRSELPPLRDRSLLSDISAVTVCDRATSALTRESTTAAGLLVNAVQLSRLCMSSNSRLASTLLLSQRYEAESWKFASNGGGPGIWAERKIPIARNRRTNRERGSMVIVASGDASS